MTKFFFLVSLLLLTVSAVQAQQDLMPRINEWVDLSASAGQSQAIIAASWVHNWRLGKKRKWEAGIGLRNTAYFGSQKDFTTAPAKLARTTTVPFVIVFAGQNTENWDTLNVQKAFVNSINLSANFGCNFNQKWSAGFNIDLIGFSFGHTSSAILTSNGIERTEPAAKPAAFNVLLTGDNDYGNLNSEFFVKYRAFDKWSFRLIYSFYFAEYKTGTVQQTAPDGTLVNRFRNKVNALGVGLAYGF